MKGKTGAVGSWQHRGPRLSTSLYKAAMKLPSEPRVVVPEIVKGTKAKISNEIILAIRTMHEVDRKPIKEVIQAYPDITENYIRRILQYELRAYIKPIPRKETK